MSFSSPETVAKVERDGFLLIPNVISSQVLDSLKDACARSLVGVERDYSMRNLLRRVPEVRALAHCTEISSLLGPFFSAPPFPVRGLFFDKTPEANWKVAWHQDLTIAVGGRREVEGFGPWSVKEGVQHVQPPMHILEGMVTARIHLDDCDTDNGALQVLPGSHRTGRINAVEIQAARANGSPVTCECRAGDVLLMRPLLLHASSPGKVPRHRRVVHLEYAAHGLPGGLEWFEGPATLG